MEALRAADVAVHPAYRRQGVHTQLLRRATELFPADAVLSLSTPNRLSRPGSVRVGSRELGVLPLLVGSPKPLRSAIGLVGARGWERREPSIDAEFAAEALRDGEGVRKLISRLRPPAARLATVQDLDYLRWRYGTLRAYRAIREERDGELAGIAFLRVDASRRRPVSIICDVLIAPGERGAARRLLRRALRAAAVDYAIACFPRGSSSWRAALLCGFLPVPRGPSPTVRPLGELGRPDPMKRSSWALCLGDLDLV